MPISGKSGIQHPVGIPEGGTTGEVLKKTSNEDFEADWGTDNTGGGGPGTGDVTQSQLGAAMGVALALADDLADSEPPPVIPGERGAQGDPGVAGAAGAPATPIVLQPEDADDPLIVPGERGAQGAAGAPGSSGGGMTIVLMSEDDDCDFYMPIPGERGPQGETGSPGAPGSGGGTTVVLHPDDIDYEEMPSHRGGVALLDPRFQRFNGPQIIHADVESNDTEKYEQLRLTNYTDVTLGLSFYDQDNVVVNDARRGSIIQSFGVFGLVVFSDDKTVQRNAVLIDRLTTSGVAIQRQRYGNTTDHPIHQLNGGIQQSYQFGTSNTAVTIASEYSLSYTKRMQVQGARRVTMLGTSRLRVRN